MDNLANKLKSFGGKLVCETCGAEKPLGNIGNRLSGGWPKCCGYTMRWVTDNELRKENEHGIK